MRRHAWELSAFLLLAVLLILGTPGRAYAGDRGTALSGTIESLPGSADLTGDWVVAGATVHVTADTTIDQRQGAAAVGAVVQIEGTLAGDGSVTARKIKVMKAKTPEPEEVELTGVVSSLPDTPDLVGDWVVDGTTVHVDATTDIDQSHGPAEVGATVEVEGTARDDGSIDARKVKVEETESPEPEDTEFSGIVQDLPGTADLTGLWRISGMRVQVDGSTLLDTSAGSAVVGGMVEGHGSRQGGGVLLATALSTTGTGKPEMAIAILKLLPTPEAPPDAEGNAIARTFSRGDTVQREDFKVAVEHLAADSFFDVFVDGVHAGSILTSDDGEGHLFLSTVDHIGGAEPLPPELQPIADRQLVEVVDAGGVVVLTGNFADAHHPGSGPEAQYLAKAPLADPDGNVIGKAIAKSNQNMQQVTVEAEQLPPDSEIQIVIDGVVAAAVMTDGAGLLAAELSTTGDPDTLPLPAVLQPVSALLHVELQATDGTVLAAGDFVQQMTMPAGTSRRLRRSH